ncbi:hypothetical protein HNP40_002232 [Mycobacteroides chelonae]|nr:hypothetical protein [Mycobacteroides chelonae]
MLAAQDEFDRQLAHLTELGYPLAGDATRLRARVVDLPASRVDPDVDVYQPIVDIPQQAYLLTNTDTGSEFCNVTPESAGAAITARGRTPLTIEEGIALVTLHPDMLRKNKCFSLAASRGKGQRVPAIWISDRRPKLGWCWDRNPHTWLGTASCGGRVPCEVADLAHYG